LIILATFAQLDITEIPSDKVALHVLIWWQIAQLVMPLMEQELE
jgi:hypothetical protein